MGIFKTTLLIEFGALHRKGWRVERIRFTSVASDREAKIYGTVKLQLGATALLCSTHNLPKATTQMMVKNLEDGSWFRFAQE